MTDLVDDLIELASGNVDVRLEDGGLRVLSAVGSIPDSSKRFLQTQKPKIVALFKELGITSIRQVCYLSHPQKRLWLLDQFETGASHYNMPMVLSLEGRLDRDALSEALRTIVERHQVLRTSIRATPSGEPVQIVQDTFSFAVPMTTRRCRSKLLATLWYVSGC
jgi:hypothetical protein